MSPSPPPPQVRTVYSEATLAGHLSTSHLAAGMCAGSRFANTLLTSCQLLADTRVTATAVTTASTPEGLPGVGVDVVFSPVSHLYDPVLAAGVADWYNTSAGSGQLNVNRFPYGFMPIPLDGAGWGGQGPPTCPQWPRMFWLTKGTVYTLYNRGGGRRGRNGSSGGGGEAGSIWRNRSRCWWWWGGRI